MLCNKAGQMTSYLGSFGTLESRKFGTIGHSNFKRDIILMIILMIIE